MDTLHFAIAAVPLGTYFVVLGLLCAAPRPLVVSGGRDVLAMGLASVGLMIVGPMELFLPEAAADRFGWFVWPMMVAVYLLIIILYVLTERPRIVVYNVKLEDMGELLTKACRDLDPSLEVRTQIVESESQGIAFSIEPARYSKNLELVAGGGAQSLSAWRRLEQALSEHARSIRSGFNSHALSLVLTGLVMLIGASYFVAYDSDRVAQNFRQMFRV